jgi:hypothetical protein
MRKLFFLFILLLICASSVNGFVYDNSKVITNLTCYDTIEIRVTSQNEIKPEEYMFYNCKNVGDNFWNCFCNAGIITPVTLKFDNKTSNVYDIVMDYQTEKNIPDSESNTSHNNDMFKRTVNFNNVKIVKEVVPKKKVPASMPKFEGGLGIFLIIISIVLIMVGLMFLLIRWLFNGSDDIIQNEKTKKITKQKYAQTNDFSEELNSIMEDIKK